MPDTATAGDAERWFVFPMLTAIIFVAVHQAQASPSRGFTFTFTFTRAHRLFKAPAQFFA